MRMRCECECLRPSFEELDFERGVDEPPLLWDELVHAPLVEHPFAGACGNGSLTHRLGSSPIGTEPGERDID